MSYFDKNKLRITSVLESNYEVVKNEFNNFDFNYEDRLGKFKIDTLFKKWKGLYEFSLKADKRQKNVFLGSTVKSRRKNNGYYELEVNNKVIWDGIILATKANLFKKFNQTFVDLKCEKFQSKFDETENVQNFSQHFEGLTK